MRKTRWLAAVLSALLLTGCSLARPEAEQESGDPFVGFYVVREDLNSRTDFWSSDNPELSEYGSVRFDSKEIGSINFPKLVLFAKESGREYVFPGLEGGYSLFIIRETMENGNISSTVVSNMAADKGWHTSVTDEGTSDVISGTIYYGPPLGAEDWEPYDSQDVWTVYQVYQAGDGRPYLDGSGNSYSGGGIGSYSATASTRIAANGVVKEDSVSVTVSTEPVPRLERLVVTEFDEWNSIVRSDELIQDELPKIDCEEETAWVLVEEYSEDGVIRTVYNRPGPEDEAISHQIVLLDDEGLGHLSWLEIF